MNKIAQSSFLYSSFLPSLAMVAISSAISPVISKTVNSIEKKIQESSKGPRDWERMIERYPELGENYKENKAMFMTISKMFPTVAENPEAAISVLRVAKDYSTGGIDVSTLSNLANVEKSLSGGAANATTPAKDLGMLMEIMGRQNVGFSPASTNVDRSWRLVT